MAQTIHDISNPNDVLGDPLRNAFNAQNDMNTELYTTKVDKVLGKDLSSNDFDNAAVNKLAGIEDGAQVNEPLLWDNIIGVPDSLFSSVGYFDYNDLATQTTPLNFTAATELQLTNDTLGVFTDITQAPFGVTKTWDTLTNTFDFTELSIGDTIDLRVDLNLTTSGANAIVKLFLRLGEGTASQYDVFVGSEYFKTSAADENVKFDLSFYLGSDDVITTPAKLILISDTNGDVKVNGWYDRIIRKSVNIVDIGNEYVKKTTSQNYSYSNIGSNVVLPLQYNGASFITLTNSGLVSLSGFDLSLITGFENAEAPYDGKKFYLFNVSGSVVNLLNSDTAELPFLFRGGANISLPSGDILEIVYSGGSFLDTFRSWGSGGSSSWGGITGTLADQTDLQSALDAKLNKNISTLTAVSLPLVDTDKLIVNRGGIDYSVDKSELSGGGTSLNTESVTITNFWNHSTSFNFLRSRADLGGFNRETLDQSTGGTSIVLADILASSSLYATSRSKFLSRVLIDSHGISGTVTEYIIAVMAYQKSGNSPFIFNIIDLGNLVFTKDINQHAFGNLTPSVIEIPAGYLVTAFLRKSVGTGFDIKASITFKFDDYVA